jgi:uncharacterized protein involved in tolerance to divalent cations
VEETEEFRLVIKAPSSHIKQIEQAISLLHNYELPQIISFDITDGSRKYLDWVREIS